MDARKSTHPLIYVVEYGPDIFRVGRSGNNIVSSKIRKSFLPERVSPFWNALPISVRSSSSVNDFEINSGCFKNDCISKGIT